ncbi:MAG: RNA-binding protein [bacterium]|nr:RNA-binding protein [bacterium]
MSTKLFVGSLPYNTTEDALRRHFAGAGEVASVKIITDRETGRSRGFAFVEYASPEDAQKAVEMFHQQDFEGRSLIVNEARPQEDRGPRGGGGGGGGGGRW